MSVKHVLQIVLISIFALAFICVAIAWMLSTWFVSQLPAERPADFSLSIHEDGGMLDQSTDYRLVAGNFIYENEVGSDLTTAEFELSEEELNYLWERLRVLRFDHIQATEDQDVYDRGGYTITLSYGDTTLEVSDAGSSFIEGGQAKRFYAVIEDVQLVIEPYLIGRGINPPKLD